MARGEEVTPRGCDLTGDKEAKERVKLLYMGNKQEFIGREERERAKGELIKQCSRKLMLRWWKWLRGF